MSNELQSGATGAGAPGTGAPRRRRLSRKLAVFALSAGLVGAGITAGVFAAKANRGKAANRDGAAAAAQTEDSAAKGKARAEKASKTGGRSKTGKAGGGGAAAGDFLTEVRMFGRTNDRNMVSPDRNPPVNWDVGDPDVEGDETNVLWSVKLGSQTYGTPAISKGIVWVGTNNEAHYDPQFQNDGGVLAAFDQATGEFLWQHYSPKLASGRVNDWPYQGICCTPYIENHDDGKSYLWYCTSRCEVVCLDITPLVNRTGEPTIYWKLDMMEQLNVFPHNMTSCSILARGDLIYVITGNGVDDTHKNIPAPEAPAIIAVNKRTGEVVWQDNSPGEGILHGQWASPAVAELDNGRGLVVAPLGDSWVYAYDAETGEIVWRFDANPKESLYPVGTRNEIISTPVIHNNRMYLATGQDPEHGQGPGILWCVDVTKEGDVSAELPGEEVEVEAPQGQELLVPAGAARPRKGVPNPNSAVVWKFEGVDMNNDGKIRRKERMNRSISTVSVVNDLVFCPDFSGFLHCLDADTGEQYWVHDMLAEMWASPLYIDGKIYLTDAGGDVAIFKIGKEKELLAEHNMDAAIHCSPVYVNGVLYITSMERLFAIQEGARPTARPPDGNEAAAGGDGDSSASAEPSGETPAAN